MQQERACKEAREMEARRIVLEERQTQQEKERDIQFLMLIHEMFSSTKQSTVPQPAVTALLRIITHQCTPFLSHQKKTSKDSVMYS